MNNHTRKFFIYTRKSTDTEDRQVRSISDQLAELKLLAIKEDIDVIDIFERCDNEIFTNIAKQPHKNRIKALRVPGADLVFSKRDAITEIIPALPRMMSHETILRRGGWRTTFSESRVVKPVPVKAESA